MKPYRIRFMTEIGCDFALWGDPFRPLPVNGDHDVEHLELVLPISSDLRDRILGWADEYRRHDAGELDIDGRDFDGRGMLLSRQLQRELGPAYKVHFHFTFKGSREHWLPTVDDKPISGWTAG